MLIATLPVLAGSDSIALAEKIISHPLVGDVRYNTGGSSPYSPRKITEILASMAKAYRKELYIDLEGRQVRVAKWSLQSRGSVVLNHDFELELPGIINFRGCGWFKIIGAKPEQRKIYIEPKRSKAENFFGESQSVNVVAKKFVVKGNLGGSDLAFMKAACRYGVDHFMLSFVESRQDIANFYRQHLKLARTFSEMIPKPELILKIESRKGIELVRSWSADDYPECRLMAARDDLFLSMVNEREKYLGALQLIIEKDPQAIVASRLMSGLLEANEEMTSGDMADLALMSRFGYKHFMLSDSMSRCFDIAMEDWQKIALPLLRQTKT